MTAAAIIDADSVELPENLAAELDSCRRLVAAARKDPAPAFQRGATCVFRTVTNETPDLFRAAVDELYNIAVGAGMIDDDATQKIIDTAILEAATSAPAYEDDPTIQAWERNDPRNKQPANGHDPGPAPTEEAYGTITARLPATITDAAIVPAKFITPAVWPNEAPPPVDWFVVNRIPRGDVTTLHGDGGAGKTDITLRLFANAARLAQEWLGHELAAGGKVLFVSGEEPERELWRRMWLHSQRDGYRLDELAENFRLWMPDKISDAAMAVADRHTGIMRPTRAMLELAAGIEQMAPIAIAVDNVAATFAGNQNDRVSVRSYVNLWRQIAHGPSKPAVLLLDHPSLSGLTNGSGRGGNMDWRNAVRSALYLHPAEEKAEADRGIRILETAKSNYGPPGNPVRLQWADGGLQLEHAPTSLHRIAKDAECDETFLRLLDEREGQGRHVSSEPRAATYAAKAFATMPNNDGFTRTAFAGAMERLLQTGKIHQVMEGPASRQRGRLVRKRA